MKFISFAFCVGLLFLMPGAASAQKKNTKRPKASKAALPAPAETPSTPSAPQAAGSNEGVAPKRNARPASADGHAGGQNAAAKAAAEPSYFYEFERPGFPYGRVLIEHDEEGLGKISFLKDGFSELITDPISLSAVTMNKLRETLDGLNFLDSTEIYQHERDFANMGNVTITVVRDGRRRTVKYNWTDNKLAKALMDEYRRISNEYTWRFEMTSALENQPLQAPGLMEAMDRYIARGEISDPPHLVRLLEQYSTDERLPLMARNRAAKIVKQIAKTSK
jgi:hypothetical protein